MPPNYINNVADFTSSITFGSTIEGLFLDFKRTIENWSLPAGTPNRERLKQEAQKEMCRDITQFANTDGGSLLIGVDETKNIDGLKVAANVVRVDAPDDMRAWIEQAIANCCVPSTFSKTIEIVQVVGGPILAINVLPSLHTVYVWDRSNEAIEVIGRTNHGKKHLNPNELERHIMNGSRATRLALEEAVRAARNKEVVFVGGVMSFTDDSGDVAGKWGVYGGWDEVPCDPIHVGAIESMSFQLRIPVEGRPDIPTLSVPYELVRACWVDVAGRLNLYLHVRTIWDAENSAFRFAEQLGP